MGSSRHKNQAKLQVNKAISLAHSTKKLLQCHKGSVSPATFIQDLMSSSRNRFQCNAAAASYYSWPIAAQLQSDIKWNFLSPQASNHDSSPGMELETGSAWLVSRESSAKNPAD